MKNRHIDDHWPAMSDEFVAWASETYHDWGREKAVILGIGGKPCTGMDFTRFLRAVSQNHKITFTTTMTPSEFIIYMLHQPSLLFLDAPWYPKRVG